MRFFSLIVLILVSFVSACASGNTAKEPAIVAPVTSSIEGIYEFVSVDLSICSRVGTFPVAGEAVFSDDSVALDFLDPILGEKRIVETGSFVVINYDITLKIFGDFLKGKFRVEQRTGGTYLMITFWPSPEEMLNMERYPDQYSAEYREKAKKGFDWIFRKK